LNKEKVYKEAAEKLWGLLDDINTLADIIKPTSLQGYVRFYQAAVKRSEQRHLILTSDGYSLYIPKPCAQEIVEETETSTQQLKAEIRPVVDRLSVAALENDTVEAEECINKLLELSAV
jgi:hypothetical protein